MKRIAIFVLFLALTRVGVAMGASGAPIGIGNFFLGPPTITDSNLNQVLGLLVGPEGQPGAAGIAGANGIPGINGVNGVAGPQGLPGAQGVQGPAGAPGAPGAPGTPGTGGTLNAFGLGGGQVALKACDKEVNISANQKFSGTRFDLDTITVSNIDKACDGQKVVIHFSYTTDPTDPGKKKIWPITCDQLFDSTINGTSISFDSGKCSKWLPTNIDMNLLDTNIGLEFIEKVGI